MEESNEDKEFAESADEIIEAMKAEEAEKARAARNEEEPPDVCLNEVALPDEEAQVDLDWDAVRAEVDALTAERDSLKDQWIRTLAEFDNYRKRTAREHERMRKTAAESLIRDLLPILDNLERAIEHAGALEEAFGQGVAMVTRQFRETLFNHGVKEIPAVGQPFDPNVHEAVTQEPSETVAAGNVVREFQKGYRVGDYVLRHSRVSVSTGAPVLVDAPTKDETEQRE